MKGELVPKAFIRYLIALHNNIRTAELFLDDKRLTLFEKNILRAWFFVRKSRYSEGISLVLNAGHNSNIFLEAQKNLVVGVCFNNLGQLPEAREYLEKAIFKLDQQRIETMHFTALYNLFICHYNRRDKESSFRVLERLISMNPSNDKQGIMIMQCELIYSILTQNFETAKTIINSLDHCLKKMSESMLIGHFYDKMDFYLAIDDLQSCYDSLNQFKAKRNFVLSENLLFIKVILENVLFDRSIYVYQTQFPENKFLYFQLRYLQALISHDSAERDLYWRTLKEISPDFFLDGEVYANNNSLFGRALSKHAKSKGPVKIVLPSGSKEKTLYSFMIKSSSPINKEDLFRLLWGRDTQDKSDMSKLKKIISIVRAKYGIDISYKNGCYSMNHPIAKAR